MNIPLKQNEKILLTLRRYFLTYAWQMFGIIILIGAPFFFMFKLFQWQPWGVYVFFAPLVIALLLSARMIFLWRSNVLLVTNERLIDIERKALFHRELHEIGWQKVQSIGSEIKGVWATIFKIGTVKVETHGVEYDFESHPIKHPDAIQITLSHILEEYEKTHEIDADGNHLERILNHIQNLKIEELETVEKSIAAQRKALAVHEK